MPNTVTSIDSNSFCFMDNVTRIILSTKLKEIPKGCIHELYSLKEISIPDSLTSICGVFLKGCESLTSITIPTHWKQIGNRYFNDKQCLCSFEIPSSIKKINGKEVVIEQLKEITIPTTITELPDKCFLFCRRLKELTIPTSITKLGKSCFYNPEWYPNAVA